MQVTPLGDSAVVLGLAAAVDAAVLARVRTLAAALERAHVPGVVDVVPAFASVTVYYEIARVGEFAAFMTRLREIADRTTATALAAPAPAPGVSDTAHPGGGRVVEIPVRYGGEFGADLADVAARAGRSEADVVALHSGAEYLVHAIGFAPGFAYLGGLPKAIHTPRRTTPRPGVPAGTVGIGGTQTGVYPLVTPGGWNLIGRTPRRMFDPARAEPALLRAGDQVRFRPIESAEFAALAQEASARSVPAAEPKRPGGIRIIKAGMLTTVQDLGRRGHRGAGVALAGAMDSVALRVANMLVGNPENFAGLEFTLLGPELEFTREALIAVGGGEFGGPPHWQPLHVHAGDRIRFGAAPSGCRGYLAIAGGIDVAPVLDSRSTYLRASLGGYDGRALRDGDVLPVGLASARRSTGRWHIDERVLPPYASDPVVRVVPGAQADEFSADWLDGEYKVTPQSDRMGVRLAGPPLVRGVTGDLLSCAVVPGTVQIPPDGQPIVLMSDAQTLGGYPQLAHVITADLPLLAQLKPGDHVRFEEVTLEEAHAAALAHERALAILHEGLAEKFA